MLTEKGFFLIEKLLYKRKYFLYFSILVLLLISSGFFAQRVIQRCDLMETFFLCSLGLFIMLFITTSIKLIKKGIFERLEFKEINEKQLQTELTLLKSQVNPHFFFNTLNNLYSLSLQKSDEVPDVVLKLSDLMRYVLECGKKQKVSLSKEVEHIKSYISLEKLRYSRNFEIKFETDGNISKKTIAPMLLIPFVENAFKHGMFSKAKNSFLHISLKVVMNRLIFSVVNSKPENSLENNSNSTGTGLENVKRRLQLLYPERHDLEIIDTKDKYKIKLNIVL